MNIEETVENLKKYISFSEKECNFSSIYDWNWHMDLANDIETLLTAYEKEKEKNKELSSQIDEHVYNGCDYELCNKKWAGKIDNIITQLKEMQGYIFFEKDVIDILQSIKEE